MITKITDSTPMTPNEAKALYRQLYFGYILTEPNLLDPDASRGIVAFTTEERSEAHEECCRMGASGEHRVSVLKGSGFPGLEIGGIDYDD